MKTLPFSMVIVLLFGVAAPAQEADPGRHMGPYLSDDALFLGWIGVRNADPEQILTRVGKVRFDRGFMDALERARRARQRLLDAGVDHVYFTTVGAPPGMEPIFVIPTDNPKAVRDALAEIQPHSRVVAGALLLGSKDALERVEKREAKANPEWARALEKFKGHPSGVLFLPP